MFGELHLERVEDLRVRLSYSRVHGAPAHDVFLLDARLPASGKPFEESAYLELLEPVVRASGSSADGCVVHRCLTHRSGASTGGRAELAVGLTTGGRSAVEPGSMEAVTVEAVTTALRGVLARVGGGEARPLSRQEAVTMARLRVAEAYPDVEVGALALNEEEHLASARMWSVGLGLAGVARFKVLLGFIDGVPTTAHLRRMPISEVVDSVGTD